MRSIEFVLCGRKFKMARDGDVRRVFDANGTEWSDEELGILGGKVEATTTLAYAQRDLERFTEYGIPDER
jgi:hypothetical protein